MKSFTLTRQIFALATLMIGLTMGLRAASVTITPANPSLRIGETQQLAADGAVVPTAMSTGAWHTCVLYSDQSVRCTGLNNQGEVGNNTWTSVSEPAVAIGTVNPVTLGTGNEHTCTLVGDGRMQCWGTNYTGQLGDGTMGGFALVPQSVHNITNAIKGITGGFHTCAILSDHTVQCWGRNQDGQMGNGDSTTDVALPAPVIGLGAVADLAGGGYHNCALMPDTTVQCWGRNARGQVGDGTVNTPIVSPHPVSGLNSVVTLSLGGYHSCALRQDATVQCWGQSDYGQIGAPGLAFSSTPVTVLANAVSVGTGFRHSCALIADGTARCWGRNTFGQLGDGTTTDTSTPVQVQGVSNALAIHGGEGHTCALMSDRSVLCWGENDYGELGIGTTTNSLTPVKMHSTGLVWTSSDPSVATVSSTGLVTAVGNGTATMTATDGLGNSGSTTITVQGLMTLAVLRQGDGGGTVTSNPAGVNCGTTCSASFVNDSQVTLTAAAAADSNFTGWTGCDSVSGATCTVAMTNARTVSAIFMLKRFTLAAARTGLGVGTVTSSPAGINCGSSCSSDYVINTAVALTASPAANSVFVGWTGCDSVSGATCNVLMSAARSVTANFDLKRFTLAVTISKMLLGNGTVTSSPSGINCGADCSEAYVIGTGVTLTANPALGSVFTGWTGCDAVNGASCTVSMNAAKSVSASFLGASLP